MNRSKLIARALVAGVFLYFMGVVYCIFADDKPNIPLFVDFQAPQREFRLQLPAGTTPRVRAYTLDGGAAWTNLSSVTGYFVYAESSTGSWTVTQSTTNWGVTTDGWGYVEFDFAATNTQTTGVFFAQILIQSPAVGTIQVGPGWLTLVGSPGTFGGVPAAFSSDYVRRDGTLSILGSLYPELSNAVDLGSAALPFRELYLGPTSLWLGAESWGATDVVAAKALTSVTGDVAALASQVGVLSGRVDTIEGDYLTSTDSTYTATVALAASAMQPGNPGTSTNLSDYFNGPGYITTDTDSNAVWGNISGTLSDQTDLTDTVARAASALQPGDIGAFIPSDGGSGTNIVAQGIWTFTNIALPGGNLTALDTNPISRVGTITQGVWQGTPIDGAYLTGVTNADLLDGLDSTVFAREANYAVTSGKVAQLRVDYGITSNGLNTVSGLVNTAQTAANNASNLAALTSANLSGVSNRVVVLESQTNLIHWGHFSSAPDNWDLKAANNPYVFLGYIGTNEAPNGATFTRWIQNLCTNNITATSRLAYASRPGPTYTTIASITNANAYSVTQAIPSVTVPVGNQVFIVLNPAPVVLWGSHWAEYRR